MPETFREAYASLTGFVSRHPEIEIGESVVAIPEPVRGDFYALFNSARRALVGEKFSAFVQASEILAANYRRAEQSVSRLITFEETTLVDAVRRFVTDPVDSLSRPLFDPLFDLLKGKESVGSFEQKAALAIESAAPALWRGGYERWAALAIVCLLEPDAAFRVPVRRLSPGERAKSMLHAPADEVPGPEASSSFLFAQPREAIFSVPDFIVHSPALAGCVGIRSECRAGLYHAANRSPSREWMPIEPGLLAALEGGLTLCYRAPDAESIALVADVGSFCRPDLALWCLGPGPDPEPGQARRIARIHARLRPRAGSLVIGPDGPAVPEDPGIRALAAGFEPDRLRAVVEALRDLK